MDYVFLHRVTAKVRRLVSNHRRVFVGGVVVMSLTFWGVGGWALWFTRDVMAGLPGQASLSAITEMAQATTLFDSADHPVFRIYKEQRIEVPLGKVSLYLVQAVISIEDQRFYDHRGVDVVRIAAAAMANLRERRAAQGGSTLTQQLARQSFLTPDKTISRKLKEVILAARIERFYTKQEILELYLNKVYFGDGLYGVEAASRGYFGKPAADLSLGEAALLAGLVKSPSAYAPTMNPERAIARRNIVLQAMLERGVISRDEWAQANTSVRQLRSSLRRDEPFGDYFKEQVRLELAHRFGQQRVLAGGLKVYTTIDPDLQRAAERLAREAVREIETRRAAWLSRQRGRPTAAIVDDSLQVALMAMDPRTGEVRAMVGGRDFDESRFNRATQARRQPGSAFKPFVYASAIEAGYEPASVLDHLDDPIWTPQGQWVPEDEHSDASLMTLRTALRTSSNRAAVRLLSLIGIPRTVEYAKRVGISNIPAVPSIALGSGEVTLQSLTSGYVPFANGGFSVQPTLIRRVEDREGNLLYIAQETPVRAISDTTAFLVTSMLSDVLNSGTAYRARRLGFKLPAAGKTGTTNEYNDAWFVGYTPKLITGVWLGFDRPQMIVPNGYGGELAVPLWARFMKVATARDQAASFDPPPGVVPVQVCRMSGKLPAPGCTEVSLVSSTGELETRSLVYTDYFIRGTEPVETCPLHGASPFGRLMAVFGVSSGPPPVPERQSGLPPPVATLSSAAAPEPAATPAPQDQPKPAPKRKRGFWARLLGIGKEDQ